MDVEGANEENVDNNDNFNLNISDDEIHNIDIELCVTHRKIDLSDAVYENIQYIIKDKEDCNENIQDLSGNVTSEFILTKYRHGYNKKIRLNSKIYITMSNGEVIIFNNYFYICMVFLCKNPKVLLILLFCICILIIRLTMV